jgi:hypothetical protein
MGFGQSHECLSLADLLKAGSMKNETEMEALVKPAGYTLAGTNANGISFTGSTLSMLSIKKTEGGQSNVEFNMEHGDCFSEIEKQLESAGFKKDFQWEAGKASSNGYESATMGVYMFTSKKITNVDGKDVEGTTYICTILNKADYLKKKEVYKSNPKIKVTEF